MKPRQPGLAGITLRKINCCVQSAGGGAAQVRSQGFPRPLKGCKGLVTPVRGEPSRLGINLQKTRGKKVIGRPTKEFRKNRGGNQEHLGMYEEGGGKEIGAEGMPVVRGNLRCLREPRNQLRRTH